MKSNIIQYESVFSESDLNRIWSDYLATPNWSYWHNSTSESDNFFWVMDLNDQHFFTNTLFSKIKSLVGVDFYLEKVYANGQTFGLDGDFHIDDPSDQSFTFLYYPMIHWNLTWGGETTIIESETKIHTIYPRPNTAVLFPSNWVHCGRGPSKLCKDLRITIAYKLKK